jgi:hypothetical protein
MMCNKDCKLSSLDENLLSVTRRNRTIGMRLTVRAFDNSYARGHADPAKTTNHDRHVSCMYEVTAKIL